MASDFQALSLLFWREPNIRGLSDAAFRLLLALASEPGLNPVKVIIWSPDRLRDLGPDWSGPVLDDARDELVTSDCIVWDDSTAEIFHREALRWEPHLLNSPKWATPVIKAARLIESLSIRIAVADFLEAHPGPVAESSVGEVTETIRALREGSPSLSEGLRKGFRSPSEGHSGLRSPTTTTPSSACSSSPPPAPDAATSADVINALGDDAPSAPTPLVVEVVERLIEPQGKWTIADFVAKRDEIRDGGADSVQAVLFSFLRDKADPRKPFSRTGTKPRRLAAVEGIAAAVEGAGTAVVETEENLQRKREILAAIRAADLRTSWPYEDFMAMVRLSLTSDEDTKETLMAYVEGRITGYYKNAKTDPA